MNNVIVKFGNISRVVLAALFLGAAPRVAHSDSKPIMVHYMPWFQSPYSLGAGKWGYHWTLNHFDPNTTNPTNGQPQIASWFCPLIGPYDSSDPAVLEYHVLLMKLAGIDGVIVDWYGPDNYYDYLANNERTLAVAAYAEKAGLKFSLCYEDSTIQAEISGGCLNSVCVTADDAVAHAQNEMLYAETNFFSRANFLKWNKHPVFLNFGPRHFASSTDWTAIFSPLATSNQPALFTENDRLAPAGTGAFEWPPMHLSKTSAASPTEPVLTAAALDAYLTAFEAGAAAWPAYVSTAFPRFHDIYAQAGVGSSYGYLDDRRGGTLRETLGRAMTNNSAVIQIATWNDYGEGTVIEPTLAGGAPATEYGYADLGIIQDFRRKYLDPTFPYHTNDLALALRFYNLRRQHLDNPSVTAELDRIFTNIVAGKITAATQELTGIALNHPVNLNLLGSTNQPSFDGLGADAHPIPVPAFQGATVK